MTDRPTIVLADDHPPTRAGVQAILEDDGWNVVAAVGTAGAAVEAALAHQPDACLLDINMPGAGIDACREILVSVPRTAVVMLTVSGETDDLLGALRAGARGYLMKGMDPSRIGQSLRDVLDGEAALPRWLTARLIEEFRNDDRRSRHRSLRKRGGQLTPKEWDVLELLREGLTTKAIAERMSVAAVTVRTHVAAILRKLSVGSRDEAVALLDEES